MKYLEFKVTMTRQTLDEELLDIAEALKDVLYDEEPVAIEDITYEIKDEN